jgi:regulator of sigma E protease
MLWIIAGIIVFLLLVILHELGHFSVAKRAGVKVLEFGIGIPPKLWKYCTDKTGTEYTINAIPLGWFVRLKWEDPTVPTDFRASDSFIMASLPKKILILLGGVAVNFAIAYLWFVAVFWHGVKPLQILPDNMTSSQTQSYLFPTLEHVQKAGLISGDLTALDASLVIVMTGGLGAELGLNTWDIITHINQQKINSLTLSKALKSAIWWPIEIKYLRNNTPMTVAWQCPSDNCLLGVMVTQSWSLEILPYNFDLMQSLVVAWQEIKAETSLTLTSLWSLLTSLVSGDAAQRSQSMSKISGPVWAVKMGELILTHNWLRWYIAFASMISLALAIFNILPIPALDWGRIVGVLIQSIFKLKPESYFTIENYFNMFFFVIMMWFGIYVIFLDLMRFRGVHIPGLW